LTAGLVFLLLYRTLVDVLLHTQELGNVLTTLVSLCRGHGPAPTTPAQLSAVCSSTPQFDENTPATDVQSKQIERILRVFSLWATADSAQTSSNEAQWSTVVVSFLIDSLLARPDDSVIVQIASRSVFVLLGKDKPLNNLFCSSLSPGLARQPQVGQFLRRLAGILRDQVGLVFITCFS
jgi:hypothetical protein